MPHGTPLPLLPLIVPIELISFLVRPFSLALRLFVAMIAGHILVKVFGYFIVFGINSRHRAGLCHFGAELRVHRRGQRA